MLSFNVTNVALPAAVRIVFSREALRAPFGNERFERGSVRARVATPNRKYLVSMWALVRSLLNAMRCSSAGAVFIGGSSAVAGSLEFAQFEFGIELLQPLNDSIPNSR